jgi:hypothetical protein
VEALAVVVVQALVLLAEAQERHLQFKDLMVVLEHHLLVQVAVVVLVNLVVMVINQVFQVKVETVFLYLLLALL